MTLTEGYEEYCSKMYCCNCNLNDSTSYDPNCEMQWSYQQGRVDKHQEIISEYQLLTEAEIKRIVNTALTNFVDKLCQYHAYDEVSIRTLLKETEL